MGIDLSIVATLYGSERFLADFVRRASAAARAYAPNYEILLINDGSPDRSLAVARALQATDPHVVIVDLSRNFGHHHAMRAGLSFAQGDQVFLIDSDLEEQPEWLADFGRLLKEKNVDAVYGVQRQRKGRWFERMSGGLFYRFFNRLSGVTIPANSVTARLMTRRYVDAVLAFEERSLFLFGILELAGFAQAACPVDKGFRDGSTYNLFKRFSLAVNALTSFSDRPLVYIFYTGLVISGTSLAYIAVLLYRKLFNDISLLGWPSLIVSIWFIGGVVIFFIGVLGIYISKIFVELKQRPNAIVRAIYRAGDEMID